MSKLSKQRKSLWSQDPHCYYCGVITINLEPFPKHLIPSPDAATIDHIYSKLHPKRYEPNLTNERRRVLCCYKCNQSRSHEELDRLRDYIRRRDEFTLVNILRKPYPWKKKWKKIKTLFRLRLKKYVREFRRKLKKFRRHTQNFLYKV